MFPSIDENLPQPGSALALPARRRLFRTPTLLMPWALPAGFLSACQTPRGAQARLPAQPFSLGVASGEPSADGFVIWTRLIGASPSAEPMDPVPVPLRWEVAEDDAFRTIVASGDALALPAFAHNVQVEVRGLRPARWYWYRFHVGADTSSASSPIGRSRTFQSADAGASDGALGSVKLAFASCQQYEQGYFGAYRHMLADQVDVVVFLGDYIYESSWGRDHVRHHDAGEPKTLDQYRARYVLYRRDPDLQRMHAAAPWIVTWDDHEVDNDYADDQGEDLASGFLQRRGAAYQAWCEHMPRRMMARHLAQATAATRPRSSRSADDSGRDWTRVRIYDRFDLGRLGRLYLLDDRQYRSHQACPKPGRGGGNVVDECAALRDPTRSLLGADQEAWLAGEFKRSGAVWNILAQQTLFAQADQAPGPGQRFWTDGWDGYPAARQRLLDTLAQSRLSNPLILGGDVHANWVSDIRADFDRPDSPVIASEFCGTSITSQGGPAERHDRVLAENPWIKLADPRRRGYGLLSLDARRCVTTMRVVDDVKVPVPTVSTLARFEVLAGRPGPQRLD